ncbi:hypothetical protein BIT28_20175 [Photobacterium proteolyticum]|uniref:PPM-type phosphatase domain-containing protein n=1 Tax=Photobacterium proteolyticum TaxID=1903952 RepID=A0A1Q9H7R5_9GAMM|nr:PP2C family serine/threonine-protein phosphatase [Photobacterium proteolyticum]OLQ83786.1 hypothetical protein BIT28_20175 [Photobacterium proteolyticum]
MVRILESTSFCFAKNEDKHNEDAILEPKLVANGLVLAVADGVGSYPGADLASLSAIEHLNSLNSSSEINQFGNVFTDIHSKVVGLSQYKTDYEKASTTLTYLFLDGEFLHVAHIGDCRAYIQTGSKLRQITKDHTKHQQLLDEKVFTKKQLKNVKGKNVITTAISAVVDMRYDTTSIRLEDITNDDGVATLFLMSDGAHEHWERNPRFSPNTMASTVKLGNALLRRIERYGPTDDYSFVSVKVQI